MRVLWTTVWMINYECFEEAATSERQEGKPGDESLEYTKDLSTPKCPSQPMENSMEVGDKTTTLEYNDNFFRRSISKFEGDL